MVLATSAGSDGIVLKLIGAPQSLSRTGRAAEALRSIRRAGEIRASHHALTRLLDIREVPGYGFVTLNEYVGVGIVPQQIKTLSLDRLLAIAINVLYALDHIHRNGSMHGDICLANILLTYTDDAFVLDYDLADNCQELRRTNYPQSRISTGTLSAWQAADIRAFVAMLITWLENRHGTLCIDPTSVAEQELASIRRLLGRITLYAPRSGYDSAAQISARISHMIRRAA